MSDIKAKMHQIRFRLGLCPRSTPLGELTAFPISPISWGGAGCPSPRTQSPLSALRVSPLLSVPGSFSQILGPACTACSDWRRYSVQKVFTDRPLTGLGLRANWGLCMALFQHYCYRCGVYQQLFRYASSSRVGYSYDSTPHSPAIRCWTT